MSRIDDVIVRHVGVSGRLGERRAGEDSGNGSEGDRVTISEEAKRKHVLGRVLSGISGSGGPGDKKRD